MSSQAIKMRKNLEKMRKERVIFDDKKSQLDAEMTKGRINMSKIKKGLRNNEIVDSPMDVSPSSTESISLNSTMTSSKQLHGLKKSKHLVHTPTRYAVFGMSCHEYRCRFASSFRFLSFSLTSSPILR
jgi:hypothetical protein